MRTTINIYITYIHIKHVCVLRVVCPNWTSGGWAPIVGTISVSDVIANRSLQLESEAAGLREAKAHARENGHMYLHVCLHMRERAYIYIYVQKHTTTIIYLH